MENQLIYNSRKLDKTKSWLLFFFLGWSYGSRGAIGKQIFFYLTCGGFGLWFMYVLFTLNSKIRRYNRDLGYEIGMSHEELIKNGIL